MQATRTLPTRLAPWALLAGLAALYAGALRTGFLNDDYLFLEEARVHGWSALFSTTGALANYFRPLSRQAWFALLTPVAGGHPLVFHLANFALLATSCWLVFRLLRERTTPTGALLGTLYFAALPLQRVNMTWISCSQDLLALTGALAAFDLHRRGRTPLAVLCFAVAALSKESALPLPAALFAWDTLVERRSAGASARRAAPYLLPIVLWAAGEWRLRTHASAAAVLNLSPGQFAAAAAHLVQSLLGIEDPSGLRAALLAARPSLAALACVAVAALGWPAHAAPESGTTRATALFALAWLGLFVVPIGPVAHYWSAYFYTTCAVGAALLVALLTARFERMGAIALAVALLGWHAVASAAPGFALVENPWVWTSHLTPGYFERGAELSTRLRAALLRTVPKPAPRTRFYFATLPPWAGFQMGNGASIRHAYRDTTLQSFFYSDFDAHTSAGQPCVFLFWDGVEFQQLYAHANDRFFQVGSDLLLLDRPRGAGDAFERGLAEHEPSTDHLYWLGWARLWSGDREGAEPCWTAFGAHDDTSAYVTWLRAARTALEDGDTTIARRALLQAIRAGIGRPEAHAELGELLRTRHMKYALLETRVAANLKPNDWLARRDLVQGLLEVHLEDQARRELATLRSIHPAWETDSVAQRLERVLGVGVGDPPRVARFGTGP